MTKVMPDYFIRVCAEAARRWDLLEADPVLAGPWHQLFRQVQSPTHVLSELLQNADDAGAGIAEARLDGDTFEFRHNGVDFDEESLRSLCQFGLSNKRHLHTIGFRGIGFKSVFSLGERVEVHTPTLSFFFSKRRFTEPTWVSAQRPAEDTIIRVNLDAQSKASLLTLEFSRWIKSPIPLLFFRNIHKLRIQGHEINKKVIASGPVTNSEYIRLTGAEVKNVLVISSEPAAFPPDAIAEVRDERGAIDIELPPCSVHVILEANATEQGLFVVLPTGVKPLLPFSINAPFIQDPARKEIKHPVNSPTNRWLLSRVGELAAHAMIDWLRNAELSTKVRARAYELLPRSLHLEGDLHKTVSNIVIQAFSRKIRQEENILLTAVGTLSSKENVIGLPPQLLQVWEPKTLLKLFAPGKNDILYPEIKQLRLEALRSWSLIEEVQREAIADRLLSEVYSKPPRPAALSQVLALWAYLQPLSHRDCWNYKNRIDKLAIVPAARNPSLLPASQVMVLGGKEERIRDEDWAFLVSLVDVVDPDWGKLVSKQADKEPSANWELAADFHAKLGLGQKVGLEQILVSAAKKVFGQKDPGEDGIRLARIAAHAEAIIPNEFKYLCKNGAWRGVNQGVLVDNEIDLVMLLPRDYYSSRVISDDYLSGLSAQDVKNWREWVNDSSKCRIGKFPEPSEYSQQQWMSRESVAALCIEKGGHAPVSYPRKSSWFRIDDFDWDANLWMYWRNVGDANPAIWKEVAFAVLRSWAPQWNNYASAEIMQTTSNYAYNVDHGQLRAAWLMKVRNITCIPDTYGKPSVPAELYRLTPDTQSLANVERFVHPMFDKPTYADILDHLGVRNRPSGVEPLLERLRALSRSSTPPITAVIDIYRALDRVLLLIETEKIEEIKAQLNSEALIYTDKGQWATLETAYQDNPDFISGILLIHPEASFLSLWDKLGVERRPTLAKVLEWLQGLKEGTTLNKSDKDRAYQILQRAPTEVIKICNRWLDTAGGWTAIQDLKWAASNLAACAKLYPRVKSRIADIAMLPEDGEPFLSLTGLMPLEADLEYKLVNPPMTGATDGKPEWLSILADILSRINIGDSDERDTQKQEHDTAQAARLKASVWHVVNILKMSPWIEGQPAGSESMGKAVWRGNSLYVQGLPPAHHRELIHELSRQFLQLTHKKVIADCVDRNPDWILAYALENLSLFPATELDEPLKPESPVAPEPQDGEPEKEVKPADIPDIEEEAGPSTPQEPVAQVDKQGAGDNGETPPGEDVDERIADRRLKRHDVAKEKFAAVIGKQGFIWNDEKSHFTNNNGSIIKHDEGSFLQWVAYNSEGIPIEGYWVGRGSIEAGFEIPIEIWQPAVRSDFHVSLVLYNERDVRVFALSELHGLAASDKILVIPSKMNIRIRG